MCYDASEASQLIYMQQVSYNAYTLILMILKLLISDPDWAIAFNTPPPSCQWEGLKWKNVLPEGVH
jgi:hypothetical protein